MIDPNIYDEECEMTNYVWEHHLSLFNADEKLAFETIEIKSVTRDENNNEVVTLHRYPEPTDSVRDLLANGRNEFQKKAANRVVEANNLSLNRCPSCDKIVRTPKAKQCLWCGHDWH